MADFLLEFAIEAFLEIFSESFAKRMFGSIFRRIEEKWPNNKAIKVLLGALVIFVSVVIAASVTLGLLFGFFYLVFKLFG